MTQIDNLFLAHIRGELLDVPVRERRAIVEQAARDCGVSVPTMYRRLEIGNAVGRKRRTVAASVADRQREIDIYGKAVFLFAQDNSFDHATCSWKLAVKFLREQGRIPRTVTEQQIYKSITRQHLVEEYQPVSKRFERTLPLALVQMDFTKSRHVRHIGDGKLMVKNPGATKIALDRRSLWCGAAIDDSSRVVYMEYFIAKGESAREAQKFLVHAMQRKPMNTSRPNDFLFQGTPEAIYVDRGSGWMDQSTQDGLEKMKVRCIVGANEVDSLGRRLNTSNKKARGKVERMMRTFKEQFEMEFSLKNPHGTTLSLAELNHALWEWLDLFNQGSHPVHRTEGKWNLFSPALASAVYPEEEALALFTKSRFTTVRDRLIHVGNNIHCLAPLFVQDGDRVEIVECHGFHYLFRDHQMYPLAYQEGIRREQNAEAMRLIVEQDDTVLESSYINQRFGDELNMLTRGVVPSCAKVPNEVWFMIESFFERPRTVGEIKAKAEECVGMIAALANAATEIAASTLTVNEEGISLEL